MVNIPCPMWLLLIPVVQRNYNAFITQPWIVIHKYIFHITAVQNRTEWKIES